MGIVDPLRKRIERRLARSRHDVFLTRDFTALSDEDQAIRALRALVAERKLIRLGKGVYAKAITSQLSGRVLLAHPGGFQAVAEQALDRLGVDWEPSRAQREFAQGHSTQIPANPVIRVNGRFSRKLRYGDRELIIEH